jgi:hypothetical protein
MTVLLPEDLLYFSIIGKRLICGFEERQSADVCRAKNAPGAPDLQGNQKMHVSGGKSFYHSYHFMHS